ncbi:MAG: hypothetical protein ABSF90_04590 [Syntrophobacteraceae bacterium]
MSSSLTPVTSSLLSPQDYVKTQTDAQIVQTLTQGPSGLSSISLTDFPTNINQAVQDTITLQNNPSLAQAVSPQSGSSGSSSPTSGSNMPDPQDIAQLQAEAALVNATIQPSSELANYPTNIDQAVQDTIALQNNPYAQILEPAPASTGSKLDTVA